MISKERTDAVWAAAFVACLEDGNEWARPRSAALHGIVGHAARMADEVVAALKDWDEVESDGGPS